MQSEHLGATCPHTSTTMRNQTGLLLWNCSIPGWATPTKSCGWVVSIQHDFLHTAHIYTRHLLMSFFFSTQLWSLLLSPSSSLSSSSSLAGLLLIFLLILRFHFFINLLDSHVVLILKCDLIQELYIFLKPVLPYQPLQSLTTCWKPTRNILWSG